MSVEYVLSSSSDEVMSWWNATEDALSAYRSAMSVVRDRFPDHKIYDRSTLNGRCIASIEGPNPGAAWRSSRDGWVPLKNHKKDQEILAMWGACRVVLPPAPGMPREVWGDYDPRTGATKVHHPGFRLIAGDVWCTWSRQPRLEGVDLTLWCIRRLSAYHLALEASEAPTSDRGAS